MKRRHRHTVMDGRVVSFAPDFVSSGETPFGPLYNALGSFEVSASRTAVVVHKADLQSDQQLRQFCRALQLAWSEHEALRRCEGRPRDDETGAPEEIA